MDTLPISVGLVHDAPPTPEQDAALAWGAEVVDQAERIALDDVAVGARDLDAFDALWWHRDRPLAPDAGVGAAAGPVEAFLADGGGLLLSLHALSAVAPLGVDPVPPDATGREEAPTAGGLAVREFHRDHPAFEGFGDRIPTGDAAGERAFARYEAVLPERGDVVACEFDGDHLLPGRKSLLGWRVGAGAVLGAGVGLHFDAAEGAGEDEEAVRAGECERLARNLLAVLGGGRLPTETGRPTDAAGMRAMRERLADDHRRPVAHLSPPANWLNDPNGLLRWDGQYHAFYQYNPGGPFHGTIHWGHAVSDDLVHWRDEPVALAPDADGPDRDGCWSGCAVVDDGTPTFVYTGGRGRHQLPCLATAVDDDLRRWRKHPDNPVVDAPPADLDVLASDDWDAEFRDHCVWREGEEWYHLIGSGLEGAGGAALLYRGQSLAEWEYVGPLLVGDREATGAMWECPELLDLGGSQLLHISNYDEVVYFIGEADLDAPGFSVDHRGLLDHGGFYAPQSMAVGDGRRLTWGWLPEARDPVAQWDAGWSGTLSLPRELALGEDGRLRQRPARELTALREDRVGSFATTLDAGDRRALDPGTPHHEVRAELAVEAGATAKFAVRESPARREQTIVRIDAGEVVVDREASSLDPGPETTTIRMPLGDGSAGASADGGPASGDDAADRTVSMRAFVDGSVLELFVDDRHCLSTRVYPTRRDATGLSLAAVDGAVDVERFEAWTLGSAWER